MIFDIKIHFESPISAVCDELAKLGRASQDAYNPELWLILYDLLKNWVAEGVTFDGNDFKFPIVQQICGGFPKKKSCYQIRYT